jgi:xanthine dehydrogenase YagS FAD-binding subunit
MLPNFTYTRPTSVKEAVSDLGREEARVMAGGTDLLGCLRDEVFHAAHVVGINHVDALKGIRKTNGKWTIGALTTITEIAEGPEINRTYPGLATAASEVASPQLRNQGTLGGNLCQKPRCWYYRGAFHCLRRGGNICYAVGGENQYHCIFGGENCFIVHPSDTAPALVAFEASAHITGSGGARTVPLEEFHVRPSDNPRKETVLNRDEVLTHITLPDAEGVRSAYRKVRARRAWDFALAGVALALHFTDKRVSKARIVLSGAAPFPWRCREAEATLEGKEITAKTARESARAAVAEAKPMRKNGYKVPLFENVVEEELLKIAG